MTAGKFSKGGMPDNPPRSLVEGVDEAVALALGIKNCRHRRSLLGLTYSHEPDVARVVLKKIAENWQKGKAENQLSRSSQNWRWSLQPQISAHNRSPEVVLERAVASACLRTGRDDWANQVPVCSGLILGASDGRRAIDLVQRRGATHFELIELKVGSDTPLYAAVEAIAYSMIWLLTRKAREAPSTAMLAAERLDVRVAASRRYYDPYDLQRFESDIDRSLKCLAVEHRVSMTFRFDVLEDRVLHGPQLPEVELLALLDGRVPLHDRAIA